MAEPTLTDVLAALTDIRAEIKTQGLETRSSIADLRGNLGDVRASLAEFRLNTVGRFEAVEARLSTLIDMLAEFRAEYNSHSHPDPDS